MRVDAHPELVEMRERYGHTWRVWRSEGGLGLWWATRNETLTDHTLETTGLVQTAGGVPTAQQLAEVLDKQAEISGRHRV